MLLKIKHAAVRVRSADSGKVKSNEAKFTGTVTYAVVGTLDRQRVRHALGTEDPKIAIRRVEKIKTACAVGPDSAIWSELEDALPPKTFGLFANAAGYVRSERFHAHSVKPTWVVLTDSFEFEMKRLIANKLRGASPEEGTMAVSTRDRYRTTIKHFSAFLQDKQISCLEAVNPPLIEMFKIHREKQITAMKQSRGGSSIALDIAILHRVFAYGVSKGLMAANPINLKHESKPGKNPKNGARPFTANDLAALRKVAGDDFFAFIVLRWTGLRASDAVKLTWANVHFERGANGEIELVTQKRGKTAIIPLSPELHDALQNAFHKQKPQPEQQVLINPDTAKPFTSRARLYHRMKSLGTRAGVTRVHPHCFRDTFVCDMLARGTSSYVVGQMVADTTETIEKHYASFVQAARDAAQHQMANGLGIEERAKLASERGRKVVGFPRVG